VAHRAKRTPAEVRELQAEIARFPFWYHNIDLGDGIWTNPNHPHGDHPGDRWRTFAPFLPEDCRGLTVLDIGCNAGYFCIELRRRGASFVLGVDAVPLHVEQARLVARELGYDDIDYRCMQAYDIDRLVDVPGQFDIVIFTGVFYHLRHPLLMLDKLSKLVARRMIFQTVLRGPAGDLTVPDDLPFDPHSPLFHDPRFPAMSFIERRMGGDISDWWLVNEAGVKALMRSAGFTQFHRIPDSELFVCDAPVRPGLELEPLPAYGADPEQLQFPPLPDAVAGPSGPMPAGPLAANRSAGPAHPADTAVGPTPIWELPGRAITVLMRRGLRGLLQEVRDYRRWWATRRQTTGTLTRPGPPRTAR
jgi:tRNA (mo5U34)-methyltransferase